jgi:hypothetical protein
MSAANKLLSGIEFGQDVATNAVALSQSFTYQEFYLPDNIERGTAAGEIRIPGLTGFSVFLNIATGLQDTVTIDWVLEREVFGVGWTPAASGSTTGAQAEGRVWFDIYFNKMVNVDPAAMEDKFRIGVTTTSNVSIWKDPNGVLTYRVFTASGDTGVDFLGNSYRNAILTHGIGNVSTDSERDFYWYSKPNPSRFAIESLYFDLSTNGSKSVIDSILIDPITPDVYFHIYYSSEGEPAPDSAGWDKKLWTRVPKTFQAKKRETHVLPSPVSARYIKIEFSHLQAKPYRPGSLQQPMRYQKHPKWVIDYFLARQNEEESNRFISSRTEVRYKALNLAYNYYLDDLRQEPEQPVNLDTTRLDDLKLFFQNRVDASDQVDSDVAKNINIVLNPYRDGLYGLIGEGRNQNLELGYNHEPISTVSSLNRDAIVFEQSYPVMFYYLTSRHTYREVSALFTYERAYFAGIRQIAFLRDRYSSATDTNLYIEIGGDDVNISVNDFVRNNNLLVIPE